jgi:hypothetical protein
VACCVLFGVAALLEWCVLACSLGDSTIRQNGCGLVLLESSSAGMVLHWSGRCLPACSVCASAYANRLHAF